MVLYVAPAAAGAASSAGKGAAIATAANVAMVAGTALSVAATIQQGRHAEAAAKAQQQAAEAEAARMRVRAGQERALAQRQALEKRRQARLRASRAQAFAASSGAGALDPDVVNLLGDIEGEGTFQAMMALAAGEDRAKGLTTSAAQQQFRGAAARAEGRAKRNIAFLDAGGTILDKAGSIAERFG